MVNYNELEIVKSDSDLIFCSVYFNKTEKNKKNPLIIFIHGFKGFKDWGGFPYLCNKIAENNFTVLSFNFSHNGIGKNMPMDFTRIDLFAENTHTKELSDLKTVLDYLPGIADKYCFDPRKIGLLAHSRGGGISIITASEDDRIKALVTLSSVASFDRYTDVQKKRWRETGYIEIPNTRTNQIMRLNTRLLDDIEENKERFNITEAAAKLKIPYLIIHGKEDLAVKFTDAEKIYNSSGNNNAELHIINNTGHTFGIEHPFKGTTEAFEETAGLCVKFFRKYLG